MADSSSLRVMCLFEAGSRLRYRSEIICLAAHLYHRFFRVKHEMNHFELYTFASAALKLAHWFYERDFDMKELCIAMSSIIYGTDKFNYLSPSDLRKLERSIDLAAQVISINIDYQINFKDTKLVTPGDLAAARKRDLAGPEVIPIDNSDESSDEDSDQEAEAAYLLTNNDKHQISSHRYLVHYLKTIKLIVEPEDICHLTRIANTAWSILCDVYWSSTVTQRYSNDWACICLMMAIEVWRERLQKFPRFWKLINRKWNLIFCDDLTNERLERDIFLIADLYQEFDRLIQQEFNTYVIDPRCA